MIVGKYLEGFNQDEQPPYPRSKIVSMFTEQIPKKDISRDRAKKYNVPIFRTVADALTHGRRSTRRRWRASHRRAWRLPDQRQGAEALSALRDVPQDHGRLPSKAGAPSLSSTTSICPGASVRPSAWSTSRANCAFPCSPGLLRRSPGAIPAVDAPFGEKQNHAVAISYSGLDIYGFHVLEALQCMVERRKGGETGVRAVQCLQNQACWNFIEENAWAKKLFDTALTHSNTRKPGNPRDLVKEPAVFVIDYNDGLKAAAFLMTGMVEDFTVAIDVEGRDKPVSTLMNLQNGRPHHHFGCLVKNIESHVRNRQAAVSGGAHAA